MDGEGMEQWVHGVAVAFDPGVGKSGGIGNSVDITTDLEATLRVGGAYSQQNDVFYTFGWSPDAEKLEGVQALDEVLVRFRSTGDVGIGVISARATRSELMDERLDPIVVAGGDEFVTARFQARRPQGWTDFDTPIQGPLAIGIGVRMNGSVGGSIDVSAVGIRTRDAYLATS
jgi:hypothetical protein